MTESYPSVLLPTWEILTPLFGLVVAPAADTNENVLATMILPPLGPKALIRVTRGGNYDGSGNKTYRGRLGGTGINGTVMWTTIVSGTSVADTEQRLVANIDATNVQRCFIAGTGGFGATTNAMATGAVETNAGTTLYITGQKATGSETMRLAGLLVELYRG